MARRDNAQGQLLLNVSKRNADWNKKALEESAKMREYVQRAMNAGFTEKQAIFFYEESRVLKVQISKLEEEVSKLTLLTFRA